MRISFTFLFLVFFSFTSSFGQFVISGERIMDVKLGADWDEIEWELGFKGKKIIKEEVNPKLSHIANEAGIEYDFVVSYQHLMWLPVSDLFFKDGKVNLIQLNSYPEYNMMLCADIGTVEGLNFWDNATTVNQLYIDAVKSIKEDKVYYVSKNKGIGVEMLDNETRTMFIFQPHME